MQSLVIYLDNIIFHSQGITVVAISSENSQHQESCAQAYAHMQWWNKSEQLAPYYSCLLYSAYFSTGLFLCFSFHPPTFSCSFHLWLFHISFFCYSVRVIFPSIRSLGITGLRSRWCSWPQARWELAADKRFPNPDVKCHLHWWVYVGVLLLPLLYYYY